MLKQYKYAGIGYLIPFVFLLLSIIGVNFIFWPLFLFSLLPVGITGIILSIIGLKKSKNKQSKNWDMGYASLILGLFTSIGGLIGLALIYVVVGS